MSNDLAVDEALLARLPLPLAQLARRAHNAKTPLERHLTAYYLWEASLMRRLGVWSRSEWESVPSSSGQQTSMRRFNLVGKHRSTQI